MKSHHALTVFLAALAFLAGYAISFKTTPPTTQVAPGKQVPQMVEVWVARKRLPLDTKLDPPGDYLKRAAFRLGEEPEDAIVVGTLPLEGRRVMRSLREAEFLRKEDLLDATLSVPASLALYSFPTRSYGSSGRLRSGMRVDVVGSWLDKNREPTVKVLIENILVVHVTYESLEAHSPHEVTLAVTPDQAKLLADIENKSGTLSVNMRSNLTEKTVVGKTFDPKSERLFAPRPGFFTRLYQQANKEP